MAKNADPANATFGQIVAAKLTERRWSQRRLAEAVQLGPTYINYLIRGKNPSARGGKFRPAPDVVQSIADMLGIPLEIAFTSAGIEPGVMARYKGRLTEPPPTDKKTSGSATAAVGDKQTLYDIAHEAALAALEKHTSADRAAESSTAGRRRINLPGPMHLVFDGKNINEEQIARYTAAIRSACDTVKREIEADAIKKSL